MKKKGISLIVLIITIVVIIILATAIIVNIAQTNIIKNAETAKEKSNTSQLKEEITLAILDIQVEQAEKKEDLTLEVLKQQLATKLNVTLEIEDNEIVGEYRGYKFRINEKFEITIEYEAISVKFDYSLPETGYTNENIIFSLIASSKNGEIKNIQVPEGIILNEDGTYTVSQNGEYEIVLTDIAGQKKSTILNINEIDKTSPVIESISVKEEIINQTHITVNLNATDEGGGILKYEYYVKASDETEYKKYETTEAPYTINGVTPEKEYTIYAIVYDKANNFVKSGSITCQTSSTILNYPLVTANGIFNCIDSEGNYYLDTSVTAKASNALSTICYDGNTSNSINYTDGMVKYIVIDPSVIGKKIGVKCDASYQKITFYFYDALGNQLSTTNIPSNDRYSLTKELDITDNVYKIGFNVPKNNGGWNTSYIYEISVIE